MVTIARRTKTSLKRFRSKAMCNENKVRPYFRHLKFASISFFHLPSVCFYWGNRAPRFIDTFANRSNRAFVVIDWQRVIGRAIRELIKEEKVRGKRRKNRGKGRKTRDFGVDREWQVPVRRITNSLITGLRRSGP